MEDHGINCVLLCLSGLCCAVRCCVCLCLPACAFRGKYSGNCTHSHSREGGEDLEAKVGADGPQCNGVRMGMAGRTHRRLRSGFPTVHIPDEEVVCSAL